MPAIDEVVRVIIRFALGQAGRRDPSGWPLLIRNSRTRLQHYYQPEQSALALHSTSLNIC